MAADCAGLMRRPVAVPQPFLMMNLLPLLAWAALGMLVLLVGRYVAR